MSRKKAEIWEAISAGEAVDHQIVRDAMGQALTDDEVKRWVDYLLKQYAHFAIWNANDTREPEGLTILNLAGSSDRFDVYDQGSRIVSGPKEIHATDRTFQDELDTIAAMAEEIYFNRGWNVELAGHVEAVRYAWAYLRKLGQEYGKEVDIIHYEPTDYDFYILSRMPESLATRIKDRKEKQKRLN